MKNIAFQKRFNKFRFIEKLGYVIRIFIAFFLSFFKSKSIVDNIWIIGLGDDIYANNGRIFYEYIVNKHRDIEIYWICEKENIKYFKQYIPDEKIISRGTIKNYIYAIKATVAIYGFSDYDVAPGFFRIFKKHKALLVNVSHGYDGLKGMPMNYYKPLPADMICAASTYERNVKITKCGADANKVELTGFARYDSWPILENEKREVKNILIMPTWRDWYEEEMLEWCRTPMYNAYNTIFKKMNDLAHDLDINVFYKFHPRMNEFFVNAKWDSFDKILPASKDCSVQELLISADLLITDYSSVFWDMVYMGKKVILYWFDENEYKSKRGLLAPNTFYPYIVKTESDFFDVMSELINSNDNKIVNSKHSYFDWIDQNNCDRIYEKIQSKLKSK